MIDIANFFQRIRSLGLFTKLTQKQVDSLTLILVQWRLSRETDLRRLAYIFATIYHETAKTMLPIEEYGKGKNRPYGKQLKRSGVAYTKPIRIYFGRGFVQLTWYENYDLMGRLLRIDLLNNPDLAMELDIAVKILFEGMFKASSSFGDFTGRCLEMYFNDKVEDPINARRIINGTDKAKLIASYYKVFLPCLKLAA